MEQLFARGWAICVGSDLVWGEVNPEDGERREVEVFYVALEEEDTGRRFKSCRDFATEEAAARCLRKVQVRMIKGAVPFESAHWVEGHPCYGSPAYAKGERAMVAAERRMDEEGTYYDGGTRPGSQYAPSGFGRGRGRVAL